MPDTLSALYTPNSIRMYSGTFVNLLDPDPDTLLIEDIAQALSVIPRFGGRTHAFYSVAQHSVDVYWRAHPSYALQALMHDASEAYLGDIPSPLKRLLPGYRRIEERFERVLATKFGYAFPYHRDVHTKDRDALEFEWKTVVINGTRDHVNCWSPARARREFLRAFYELKPQHWTCMMCTWETDLGYYELCPVCNSNMLGVMPLR